MHIANTFFVGANKSLSGTIVISKGPYLIRQLVRNSTREQSDFDLQRRGDYLNDNIARFDA